MDFTNKPMKWNNAGVQPSAELSAKGYVAKDKPAADTFNYFFNHNQKCIEELQTRGAGWGAEGDEMSTTPNTTATAGSGAEIFNDYRKRTYDADGKASAGNVATGNRSHAEGSATTATGNSAHAEGVYSKASGVASHAEGGDTNASNYYAHAEGYQTEATASYAHAEGLETTASGSAAHSEGQGTKSIARCTHTEGYKTEASKDFAHAEGNECIASGIASHAEGSGTLSTAYYAHAEGGLTAVIGNYSHIEGHSTNKAKTTLSESGVELSPSTDNGAIKTAWNDKKFALVKGNNAHGEGMNCLALSANSHTEGKETITEGEGAHAEGTCTRAIGNHSHAEGKNTTASGRDSHAEGFETTASGDDSHAEGWKSTASGTVSHAEGTSTANGYISHSEGWNATANGYISHAEGWNTTADGICSHAGGYNTTAKDYQTVIGKFNKVCEGNTDSGDQSAENTIFIVGNGTIDQANDSAIIASNALRTTADGQTRGLKSFLASGADFAEYFEWIDGNPDNEDRRGRIVTLDGEKIRFATAEDNYILGVVSTTGAFIGNSSSENWQGKYLKDVFGEWLTEKVEVPETVDENTGETIPAHTATRYVVNPDYNAEQEYVSREFRKEWSPVGFHGQVVVVDDGTCEVNSFCKPSINGIGTASSDGYYVMSRLDDTHIKVLVK